MESKATYGVVERTAEQDEADQHAEQIRLGGYTVVRDAFTTADMRALAPRLDAVVEQQTRDAGGVERMTDIGEQETARCCFVYDDAFTALLAHPRVMAICRRLLGDFFILTHQNGIVNSPGRAHQQRAYHRDLAYQHLVTSRPLALSALLCVDEFTVENGATIVLPGSHKLEEFPSQATADALQHPVEAPIGSFLVFDAMMFHRAGTNTSNRPRRAVNHVYARPFMAQPISFPDMLGGRYADDPELARLLGYVSGTVRSLDEWRERRRKQKAAAV